ncbi:MAG TPA: adenylate/guanylate cyclase domain-containing protein [Thermoanaerobaculia bacterium]|nr:adenylate/guanylate cyclase domain-containing protein [Thermoanaerobaculia bacterium]
MPETRTESVKYLFSDIVGFTKDRSVEAQSDLVSILNQIVRESFDSVSLQLSDHILIPTGDGICIALLMPVEPYDIHVTLGLEILRRVAVHNAATADSMRCFELRIGLNQNVDNIVTDINGKTNVAGAGINMAQRIMSQADRSQIMAGRAVYDTLSVREAYLRSFRRFTATAKHNVQFDVYQLIKESEGLSIEAPSAFRPREAKPNTLTKFAAFYIALALKSQDFLLTRREDASFDYNATVWLYFQAKDMLTRSEASEFDKWRPKTHGAPTTTAEEQYNYYDSQDFWMLTELTDLIASRYLEEFSECFEGIEFVFVSKRGKERLQEEWPDVAKVVSEQADDAA